MHVHAGASNRGHLASGRYIARRRCDCRVALVPGGREHPWSRSQHANVPSGLPPGHSLGKEQEPLLLQDALHRHVDGAYGSHPIPGLGS